MPRPDDDNPGPLALHEQLAHIWLPPQPRHRTPAFDLAERVLYRLDLVTEPGRDCRLISVRHEPACSCEACATWRAL